MKTETSEKEICGPVKNLECSIIYYISEYARFEGLNADLSRLKVPTHKLRERMDRTSAMVMNRLNALEELLRSII